jgi:hypothetical protein
LFCLSEISIKLIRDRKTDPVISVVRPQAEEVMTGFHQALKLTRLRLKDSSISQDIEVVL